MPAEDTELNRQIDLRQVDSASALPPLTEEAAPVAVTDGDSPVAVTDDDSLAAVQGVAARIGQELAESMTPLRSENMWDPAVARMFQCAKPDIETHGDDHPQSTPDFCCGLREKVMSKFDDLLRHDDPRTVETALLAEDRLRLPWYSMIAKIASREINVLCIPVSELARKYLVNEISRIREAPRFQPWRPFCGLFSDCGISVDGENRWWMSDDSVQVSGEERARNVAAAIIRDATKSHAFDETPRMKPRKGQQFHDHSVFRQLAQSFVPPPADAEAISSTHSNHPVAGASRRVGVTATRDALASAGFIQFDESKCGYARDGKAAGRRLVNWIKDLQHPDPGDESKPGMVYTFVDQDMYIDSFARYAGENMVIITPEYTKLAGEGTDSTWYYTLDENGEVVVNEEVKAVDGGRYRNQRPWDYSTNDYVFIEHVGKSAFTTYNVVVQYQKGSHHKWVWLARNVTTSLSKALCDSMLKAAHDTPLCGDTLRKASNVTVVKGDKWARSWLSEIKQKGKRFTDYASFAEVLEKKDNTFLLGLFGEPGKPMFSIKYAQDMGSDVSMEFTENLYHLLSLMGDNKPKGYGVSEVKRVCQMHYIWRPGGIEPLIVAFFGIPIEYRPRPNIMYVGKAGPIDDDTEGDGTAIMGAPNVAGKGPGVADTQSAAAFAAYKEKRLLAFRNKKTLSEELTHVVEFLLDRFIQQISKETGHEYHTVPLVGAQVIYETRTAALQAARLQRNNELDAVDPPPRTNLKKEVAPKASPAPRGVTQYNEEMAIQTGRVGLLVKEVLKYCEWYQPGNSPMIVAESIRKITEAALLAVDYTPDGGVRSTSGLHDTDYTKMDETISRTIYNWFVRFVMKFVHPNDKDEVAKILRDNVNIMTKLGNETVNTGYKNNSGSGVTTELNSFVAAFVEYVITTLAVIRAVHGWNNPEPYDFAQVSRTVMRRALNKYSKTHEDTLVQILYCTHMFVGGGKAFDSHGRSKTGVRNSAVFRSQVTPVGYEIDIYSIAYAIIGPKYGDDGIGANLRGVSDADWEAAATWFTTEIGMILKVSFTKPEEGTFFLGRYYPKPTETLASYADVPKALRKLSISRNSDPEKYFNKLQGYATTDWNTPGIHEYLIVVGRLYGQHWHDNDGGLQAYDGVQYEDDGTPILSERLRHLLDTDRDTFYRVAGNGAQHLYGTADEDLFMERIAPQCGFSDSHTFGEWLMNLENCTTWEELDEFLLPMTEFDPDEEPEGTVRADGPVASLRDIINPEWDSDSMAAAAALALHEMDEWIGQWCTPGQNRPTTSFA